MRYPALAFGIGAHGFELHGQRLLIVGRHSGVEGDLLRFDPGQKPLRIEAAKAPCLLGSPRVVATWPKTIVYGRIRKAKNAMPPRYILSPQSRAALFDPPTDAAAIVRHYTFSAEDMALIRERRRRAANRLGFAVNLAYLRFPGRVIGVDEIPTPTCWLSSRRSWERRQEFEDYAQRQETRREHLGEIQAYLDFVLSVAMTSAQSRVLPWIRRRARIAATSSSPR